eukprot:7031127-Ditylum_brightwellii.AAC.1
MMGIAASAYSIMARGSPWVIPSLLMTKSLCLALCNPGMPHVPEHCPPLYFAESIPGIGKDDTPTLLFTMPPYISCMVYTTPLIPVFNSEQSW